MRWLCLMLLLGWGAAFAQVQDLARDYEAFDDPALEARYRELIHSIRCMKCVNQSIAESSADSAGDLRREVRERVAEGQTDGEIRRYLAERYGDFINFMPPVKPSTWLLWAAPALLMIGGAIIFGRILHARMRQPLAEDIE